MSEFTYPVMVKPVKNNHVILGTEYWIPDFEECDHVFVTDISDNGLAMDIAHHLMTLVSNREMRGEQLPTPKWYGRNACPPDVELRFVTVNTNTRSGYFSEPSMKGEAHMGFFKDEDIEKHDDVNHPSHYTQSGIECIDAIDSVTSGYERPGHGYYAGQVLKYIWRAPFKGHYLQDLEKAQWYLNRLVKKVQDEADYGN